MRDDVLDRLYAPHRREKAARFGARARLEIVEGSGHVPSLERPEAFERAVADFLREA